MNPRDPRLDAAWETRLDREFKGLPDRAAPHTLIPRVMAAVQARVCAPWYRRPWWDWPPALKIVSLLGMSGLLGLATWLVMHCSEYPWTAAAAGELKTWLAPLNPVWTLLTSLAGALALVFKGTGSWILLGAGGLCAIMYLSCVALGSAVYRVASYRRIE